MPTSELSTKAGGRPKLDEGDPRWKERFCEDLYRYDNDREKASKNSPYSFKTILQKLTPGYTSYDKEFHEMVRATELQISARAEALMVQAAVEFGSELMSGHSKEAVDRAKILDTQSRVAERVTSKLDQQRWGRNQRVELNSTNRTEIDIKVTTIEQRHMKITALLEDQRRFLESRGAKLPVAIPAHQEPILEAEIVEPTPTLPQNADSETGA